MSLWHKSVAETRFIDNDRYESMDNAPAHPHMAMKGLQLEWCFWCQYQQFYTQLHL